MAQPYLGEIQAFAFNFNPIGWMPCLGQTLPVNQFATLFSLIGTNYGGNGTTNFNLPNLGGFIVNSQGQAPGLSDRVIGEQIGSMTETLSLNELPIHSHVLQLGLKGATGGQAGPGNAPGAMTMIDPAFGGFVVPPSNNTTFAPTAMGMTGGNSFHANDQPTLAMIYCICIAGIFPNFG